MCFTKKQLTWGNKNDKITVLVIENPSIVVPGVPGENPGENPGSSNTTSNSVSEVQVLQIAEKQVERNGRTSMSQMRISIYCRATNIHTYMGCMEWLKEFFSSVQRVVNNQWLFHNALYFFCLGCKGTINLQKTFSFFLF